jgi:hypothetical protein
MNSRRLIVPRGSGRGIVAAQTSTGKGPGVSSETVVECPTDVRFTPESGHLQRTSACPLCANSGRLRMQFVNGLEAYSSAQALSE